MAYEILKQQVNTYIAKNHSGNITAELLNGVLIAMIDALGEASGIVGIIPTSEPQAGDANITYIALQDGTYTNFGNTVVANEVALIKKVSNAWVKVSYAIPAQISNVTIELRQHDTPSDTPTGSVSLNGNTLQLVFWDLKGAKGEKGDTVHLAMELDADNIGGTGTPSATIEEVTPAPEGCDQKFKIVVANIKGDKGDKGDKGNNGLDAVNPFKGWFDAITSGTSGTNLVVTDEDGNLVANYPNPVVGDYAYIKTWDIDVSTTPQTETPIVKIYECSTAGTWTDSGREFNPAYDQSFETGQHVNQVGIDNTPTPGSDNLVKSSGVCQSINELGVQQSDEIVIDSSNSKNCAIKSDGTYSQSTSLKHFCIPVSEGEVYYLISGNENCRYAFVLSDNPVPDANIDLIGGSSVVNTPFVGGVYKVVIPSNCPYLIFNALGSYNTRCFRLKNTRNYNVKSVLCTPSQFKVLDNAAIELSTIRLVMADNSTRVVYANDDHSMKRYVFSDSSFILVLTKDDNIIKRDRYSDCLDTDIILLIWRQNYFCDGLLYPLAINDGIKNGLFNRKFGIKECVSLPDTYIYNNLLAKSEQSGTIATSYYIQVKKGDILKIIASEISGSYTFAFGFLTIDNIPLNIYTALYYAVYNGKYMTTNSVDEEVYAPFDGYLVVYHSNTKFLDTQVELLNIPTVNSLSTVKQSYYSEDGSIYIPRLIVRYGNSSIPVYIDFNGEYRYYQPLQQTFQYVLTKSNTIEAKITADLVPSDVVLLSVSYDGTTQRYTPFGGWLYPDYINKKNKENPFFGKKIVVTGGSSTEGWTLQPTDKRFVDIIAEKLGMTAKNYGIAGSSVAKHRAVNDMTIDANKTILNGVFYSVADFDAAKATLDTSKMYLVKDAETAPRFHLYKKDGSDWVVVSQSEITDNTTPFIANYDDIFVKWSDWQSALSGGTLDTSKTYLVHENPETAAWPWYRLWHYVNGSWVKIDTGSAIGDTSLNNAKAPLVDRISEMDTDADVIIIDTGGNDWGHFWTPFGDINDAEPKDKTTFCGAMHLICRYLVDTYPGKIIMWTSRPAAWRYSDATSSPNVTYDNFYTRRDAPNLRGFTNQDYANAQKEILRIYGINYFDLGAMLGFSQQNRWWCGDASNGGFYAHPNAQAQPLIADVLIKEMLSYKV